MSDLRYQAVIFDLFGTLVPSFAPAEFERSLVAMAAAVDVELADFRRLWAFETADARMTGALATVEANVEHIARRLGAVPTAAQLAAAARARMAFYRRALVPRPDAVATLATLRARGLRLGLISDCSCETPALWPETPFAALIEAPVFSCVEGLRKPERRLYDLACARLGVAPQACVYVADGYNQELSTAAALGMQAVLIAAPGEVLFEPAKSEAATWRGPGVQALAEVVGLL